MTSKPSSLTGHVGARVPKHIELAIKAEAARTDRPVAYIVRRTLLKHFGQKNE